MLATSSELEYHAMVQTNCELMWVQIQLMLDQDENGFDSLSLHDCDLITRLPYSSHQIQYVGSIQHVAFSLNRKSSDHWPTCNLLTKASSGVCCDLLETSSTSLKYTIQLDGESKELIKTFLQVTENTWAYCIDVFCTALLI